MALALTSETDPVWDGEAIRGDSEGALRHLLDA